MRPFACARFYRGTGYRCTARAVAEAAAGHGRCRPDPRGAPMQKVRKLLAFWWIPYSASTWRRLAYAVLAPLLAIVGLVLAVAGRADAAARYQRRLAVSLIGAPADGPPRRPTPPAIIAISAVILAAGVACWLLLWRFTYAVLAVPLAANFVALTLAGRVPAANRLQHRLARRLAGERMPRRIGARVAAQSVASLVVGLISWTLLNYLLVFFVLGALAYPLAHYVDFSFNNPSYGGPPPPWAFWSGIHRVPYHGSAWANHAIQFVVTLFPLLAWALRGLTRLQGWLTQALLGSLAASPAVSPSAAQPSPLPTP